MKYIFIFLPKPKLKQTQNCAKNCNLRKYIKNIPVPCEYLYAYKHKSIKGLLTGIFALDEIKLRVVLWR